MVHNPSGLLLLTCGELQWDGGPAGGAGCSLTADITRHAKGIFNRKCGTEGRNLDGNQRLHAVETRVGLIVYVEVEEP